jgi:hypothetical protein
VYICVATVTLKITKHCVELYKSFLKRYKKPAVSSKTAGSDRSEPMAIFSNLVHSTHTYLPLKMEQTECSEMSAYKIQKPGNYPEESKQHSEHGESLKSTNYRCFFSVQIKKIL